VKELERKKVSATQRPCRSRAASTRSRHIPAEVKRVVWQRDAGRCQFVGTQGRCVETGFLEYHHIVPYADGGQTTADNLELRCRAHNGYEAELWSGVAATPSMRERMMW
jgi:5-methylcytosine-specific restriction endonuclease McrA